MTYAFSYLKQGDNSKCKVDYTTSVAHGIEKKGKTQKYLASFGFTLRS